MSVTGKRLTPSGVNPVNCSGGMIGGDLYYVPYNAGIKVYSVQSNTWKNLECDNEFYAKGQQACTENGKLYCYSQYDGTIHCYDPATNQWTVSTPSPTRVELPCIIGLREKLYIIGGRELIGSNSGSHCAKVQVYNPSTQTWGIVKDFPLKLIYASAGVLGGRLYVFAGTLEASVHNGDCYRYNEANDSWELVTTMIPKVYGATVVPLNEKFYLFGGMTKDVTALTSIYEYDPKKDRWKLFGEMMVADCRLIAGFYQGKMYVSGGLTQNETYEYSAPEWNSAYLRIILMAGETKRLAGIRLLNSKT